MTGGRSRSIVDLVVMSFSYVAVCVRCLRCALRFLPLSLHEVFPERLLRCVLIVDSTAQADALRGCPATPRDLDHVVELEPCASLAAPAVLTDERTLAAVTLAHGALDRGGDVAPAERAAARVLARPLDLRVLPLLELADVDGHGAIQQLLEVSGPDLMPEQLLGALDVVSRALPNGHLQGVTLRRQRCDRRRRSVRNWTRGQLHPPRHFARRDQRARISLCRGK